MKTMLRTIGLGMVLMSLPLLAMAAAVDAGNAMCPVSGEKVSGQDFGEHAGKKYGLCCSMCLGKFNKNPEKYTALADKGAASGESMM